MVEVQAIEISFLTAETSWTTAMDHFPHQIDRFPTCGVSETFLPENLWSLLYSQ